MKRDDEWAMKGIWIGLLLISLGLFGGVPAGFIIGPDFDSHILFKAFALSFFAGAITVCAVVMIDTFPWKRRSSQEGESR